MYKFTLSFVSNDLFIQYFFIFFYIIYSHSIFLYYLVAFDKSPNYEVIK